MTLYDDLKLLERQAKEAEYWKSRFQDLSNEIKQAINKLNELVLISKPPKLLVNAGNYKIPKKCLPVAESLYKKMKIEEIEITNDMIRAALEEAKVCSANAYCTGVRLALKNMSGIEERKYGKKLFLYYWQSEGKKEEIKFEKTSFMG